MSNNILPSLDIDKVKKIIGSLDVTDLKNESVESLVTIIEECAIGYIVRAILFDVQSLFLYRGVCYSEKPSSFEKIIYPPLDKSKINRANWVGEQMFYAASSKKAVFYELKVKPGDRLVISEWNNTDVLLFNNVGFTRTNIEDLGGSTPNQLVLMNEKDGPKTRFLADWLSKTFCKNISDDSSDLYKLTNAIAVMHLGQAHGHKISGLFYPTIRFNANENNFAIIKSTIDRGLLEFLRIEFIEIISQENDQYSYKVVDIADKIENGKINWKNLNKHWTVSDVDELYFYEENGETIAYNGSGGIIHPE